MPKAETRSAGVIIDDAIDSQGWTDETVVDLLLEYIENQQSNDAFADFIEEKKKSA